MPLTREDILVGIVGWSAAEKINLVEDIWDSVLPEACKLPVTGAQMKEYQRRLDHYRQHPETAVEWHDFLSQLKKSRDVVGPDDQKTS